MKNIVSTLTLIFFTFTANAVDSGVVVKPQEKVYGKSLDEYANIWWQWAHSMPEEESPIIDQTGSQCHVNQTGHVWFLAGGYGSSRISRTCEIPSNHYLFFPVINMVYYPRADRPLSCESVKKQAAMNNDYLRSFIVMIDNVKVVNPAFHRYSSPDCFDLLGFAPKSLMAPKIYPSATDGYWVMLKPLPLGQHKIKFMAEYHNPGEGYGKMTQDIEYQINIIEAKKQPNPLGSI